MIKVLTPNIFKNKHQKRRCFIIGSGPSINDMDLSPLTNEITFGVNSLHSHWLPFRYFCVTDGAVWANNHEVITKKIENDQIVMFLSIPEISSHSQIVNLPRKEHLSYNNSGWYNIADGIFRNGTVIVACLQLAFFMGIQEVYLLGCDCNYEKGKEHFDGSPVDGIAKTDWTTSFNYYSICKKYYEEDGRIIHNATKGGKLEVFPRVIFEDLWK